MNTNIAQDHQEGEALRKQLKEFPVLGGILLGLGVGGFQQSYFWSW